MAIPFCAMNIDCVNSDMQKTCERYRSHTKETRDKSVRYAKLQGLVKDREEFIWKKPEHNQRIVMDMENTS